MSDVLKILLATIILGSSGVFIKLMNMSSIQMSFIRSFVPCIIIAVILSYKKQTVIKGINKTILLASFFNALRLIFFFTGFQFTSINKGVIMLYTWPVFVSIISSLRGKEKLYKHNIIMLILAFTGIFIIYFNEDFSFNNKDFIGMSSMLISALIYSFSIILFKDESSKFNGIQIAFFQNLIASAVLLPAFLFFPVPDINSVSLSLIYSFLIGVIAFTLFFSALKKLKASVASHLAYMEVISAMMFGYIFFSETFSTNMIAGSILITVSVIFLRKK